MSPCGITGGLARVDKAATGTLAQSTKMLPLQMFAWPASGTNWAAADDIIYKKPRRELGGASKRETHNFTNMFKAAKISSSGHVPLTKTVALFVFGKYNGDALVPTSQATSNCKVQSPDTIQHLISSIAFIFN